jgi:streptomycin 6-kinase
MPLSNFVTVPRELAAACRAAPERRAWLERLQDAVHDVRERWSLTLGQPFEGEGVSCAWVAPATRSDGTPAVLKLGMPHMEGEHELEGLIYWSGNPTVRLLEGDPKLNAMLLERCEPGTALRTRPEAEQDVVIAGLLRRLWRPPPARHPFRPLAVMTADWSDRTRSRAVRMADAGLVRTGLNLFDELPRTAAANVPLATDLHAGNVLRAQREPWLVIDPKPFFGDPAYDATQHLLNCEARLRADPLGTIRRFSDLLGVDGDRVRLWTFARAAAEWCDPWERDDGMELARLLAP